MFVFVRFCYNTECNQYFNVTTRDVLIVITQNYNDSKILFSRCYNMECSYFQFSLHRMRLSYQRYNTECYRIIKSSMFGNIWFVITQNNKVKNVTAE